MSARDVQARELPVGMGPCKAKDWDGSNVLGPCIVTADEIDPHDVDLERPDQRRAVGRGQHQGMHHTFEDMIAYASQGLTLRAGEVLGSGTATGGSGLELDRWLQPGDVIEMEAAGIGVLKNRVGPRAVMNRTHPNQHNTQEKENTMAFVVAAIWKAKEGEEKRVEETILKMTPALARRGGQPLLPGPGLPEDPRTFFLYEQYVDEAGYEAHKATTYFQENVFGYIIEYLEERSVKTYQTIDV